VRCTGFGDSAWGDLRSCLRQGPHHRHAAPNPCRLRRPPQLAGRGRCRGYQV